MNKLLQKVLGTASVPQPATEAVVENLAVGGDDANQALQTTLAELIKVQSELSASNAEITKLQAALTVATTALKQSDEAAKVLKIAGRKEKLSAMFGTESLENMDFLAESFSDAQFDLVVSALNVGRKGESESELFKEVGIEAKVDQTKVSDEMGMTDYLKSRFAK